MPHHHASMQSRGGSRGGGSRGEGGRKGVKEDLSALDRVEAAAENGLVDLLEAGLGLGDVEAFQHRLPELRVRHVVGPDHRLQDSHQEPGQLSSVSGPPPARPQRRQRSALIPTPPASRSAPESLPSTLVPPPPLVEGWGAASNARRLHAAHSRRVVGSAGASPPPIKRSRAAPSPRSSAEAGVCVPSPACAGRPWKHVFRYRGCSSVSVWAQQFGAPELFPA